MPEIDPQIPDRAAARFEQGWNCAEAVFAAIAEAHQMDPTLATRIATPLGGGLGGTRQTCGALTGALLGLGLLSGRTLPDPAEKRLAYQRGAELLLQFSKRHGATDCKHLRELACKRYTCEDNDPRIHAEFCSQLVRDAAALALNIALRAP